MYWILYEGTPGGKLDIDTDFWVRSDGKRGFVSEKWTGDIPAPEWIYFGDANLNRVLYLIHHEDDTITDDYWQMQGNMTVFGFGRKNDERGRPISLMNNIPTHLTIGFVDAKNGDFERVSKYINSAYKDLTILLGSLKVIR